MKLSQLLSKDAIYMDIEETDKWALISKLTDILVDTDQVSSEARNPVHDALVEREKSMSTGMENGVAIPHCCVDMIPETVVSLAISKEGIEFDSIDTKPTHLIILLVTPKNKTKMHIKTLAEIAKLLNHEGSRQRLVARRVRSVSGPNQVTLLVAPLVVEDVDAGIDRLVVTVVLQPADLVVEVRTGAPPGVPHRGNDVTLLDPLTVANLGLVAVSEESYDTAAMTQRDQIPVPPPAHAVA